MVQRGRKSESSLAIKVGVISESRLLAPLHISDAELSVWNEVVSDSPASSFTPMHTPLLELYCRHVTNARILAEELLNFDRSWLADDDGLKRYDRLLAMSERESRASSSLATRLRITRQAVDHPTTVARTLNNQIKTKKPWELSVDMES